MMTHTIGHGLNQSRFLLLDSSSTSFACSMLDRKYVVSVHTNRIDTVADTTRDNTVTTILFLHTRADGVLVVPAEEDNWSTQSGSKIEAGVEVTFAGSSVTHVHDRAGIFLAELLSVSTTDSLWNLRTQRGTDGVKVQLRTSIVNWHLASTTRIVLIAKTLIDHLLCCVATPHENTSLTILSIDNILRVQRTGTSHECRLLTVVSHVEADLALSLNVVHDVVERVQLEHGSVHTPTQILIVRIVLGCEYFTTRVHDLKTGARTIDGVKILLEGELVNPLIVVRRRDGRSTTRLQPQTSTRTRIEARRSGRPQRCAARRKSERSRE
mmetsp:Transcript_50035/g.125687  ORF Transcript_50035/g.125687 Transcript_50035/m.125687 type:complete len:325 (+) Transcript_50035:424-1398(+)